MFQRLYVMFLYVFNFQEVPRCRLNSRVHFGEPLPIVIRNGHLLEPTDKFGNVDLIKGEILTISCEGSGHLVHPNMNYEEITADITCDAGDYFTNAQWLNSSASFYMFKCSVPPSYISQRTNRSCYDNNVIYEVGYHVRNVWYPVYESCFDNVRLNPIYSKYTQKAYNANYQTRVERPYFIDDNIYRYIPVGSLFSPNGQKYAIQRLVGPMINEYFTAAQSLSRGHLAAKTDFVFAFGERATFHYVNCAPQWTGFNGGNWNTLEVDLRNHINSANTDTVIYTGTFGVSHLLNKYKERVNLYLYNDENNNPMIPVPEYYYKVVYEPATSRGIAFVGINNPYYTLTEAKSMFFCQDICRGNMNYSWLSWHPDNNNEGYTFCCTLSDFRGTVPHIPYFESTGVFT